MRGLLREPLVHFLVIGAVLFGLHRWLGDRDAGSTRIVLTPGRIEHLSAGFVSTWNRLPNEVERRALIEDYVRDEIASREATALGLDRDDTVIRRRLRQKLEFLAEDAGDSSVAGESELRAYFAAHEEEFRAEPTAAFRQVYVDPEGGRAEAERLLARLRAAGPAARISNLGDGSIFPPEVAPAAKSDLFRLFGEAFAESVFAFPLETWQGPVSTDYGFHLVLVHERAFGGIPSFEAARADVERELLAARRRLEIERLYERLRLKYTVIEEPAREVTR